MKIKEIRDLKTEELREHLRTEEEQLDHMRFQHAVAQLENPMVLRQKRRLVARLKTLLKERNEVEG